MWIPVTVCTTTLANRLHIRKVPLPGEVSAIIAAGVRQTCACAQPQAQGTVDVEEVRAKPKNPRQNKEPSGGEHACGRFEGLIKVIIAN